MGTLRKVAITGVTIAGLAFSVVSLGNHSWGNYHWERGSNPLKLNLGDNVNNVWYSHLEAATADWKTSTVLDLAIIDGNGGRRCKPSTGAVEICNGSYGNNGWLGIAGISVSGDHIQSGYVKLNDTYFDTSTYDTPAWRQMVTCQEIGHIFGLAHQDENFSNSNLGTCMDYTSYPDSNQSPNQHDYDQLADIYGHLDGSSGGGGDTGGGGGCFPPNSKKCNGALPAADILAQIDMDGPAQWGRLVSAHGPMEVYELDFGGGRKIITHVTWTLEAANRHKH